MVVEGKLMMNIYKEIIHEYIQDHKNEIVSDLKRLIKIPSVRGEAEEAFPFGKACGEALEYTKMLYEREKLETELNQDGGYLLSYLGNGKKSIGIFSHADVVPVSDDWILTNPFEPLEKDGYLIGRGTLDDKAGIIISLYCAKMFKELNIPFNSRLICFTGVNEESGMQDIKNYLASHRKPDFSFVPDSGFPLYRGNKGRITLTLTSKNRLSNGYYICGGTGATVIGEATAVIPFKQELFNEILTMCDEKISIEMVEENMIIKAKGVAKHAALPEGSLSAVSLICDTLNKCTSIEKEDNKIFEDIYNFSSSYYGECFDIESYDKEFGKLTCVLTKISTEKDGRIRAEFNIRYGLSIDKNTIFDSIRQKSSDICWSETITSGFSTPHYLPENNIFIKRLMEVYKSFSSWEGMTSYINAGGTYRQYLEDGVEIGTSNRIDVVPGLPAGHGRVHQPDECISIDGFLKAIEITMNMVLECDKIMEDLE